MQKRKFQKIPLTKKEWEHWGIEYMYSNARVKGVPFRAWLQRNYKKEAV